MAKESDVKIIGTIILSIAMLAFALAFYAMESVMYFVLLFIGIALALMVAVSAVSSKRGK